MPGLVGACGAVGLLQRGAGMNQEGSGRSGIPALEVREGSGYPVRGSEWLRSGGQLGSLRSRS